MLKYSLIALLSLAFGVALSRWTQPAAKTPAAKIHAPGTVVSRPSASSAKSPRAEAMDKALAGGQWEDPAKKWAEDDPAGFHAWLLRQDPAPPLKLTETLFLAWVLRDPDGAFAAAVNLPRRFQRGEFIPDMLNTLLQAGTSDELAFRWLGKVSGEFSGFGSGNPAFLTTKSPEEAAALLSGVTESFYGGRLLNQLGRRWAAQDLDAARQWLDGLPTEKRVRALDGIMQVWAEKDVQGALNYLAHEASTAERHNICLPLKELAGKDPAAAFQWWEKNMGVPDPNTVRHMLTAWKAKDAEAAKQYVLSIEDTALRRQFLKDYAEGLGRDGSAFAMSLPPGNDRNAVVPSIAFEWVRQDPAGAMAYLRTEPASKAGRDAVAAMVSGMCYSDNAGALAWANEVPEGLRERAIVTALQRWREDDVVAAAAAVRTMPDGPLKAAAEKALAK